MKNFEEKLKRLETLTDNIKSPDISLEDALDCFEEGIKLSKELETQLEKAQAKIQILVSPTTPPKQKTDKTQKAPSGSDVKLELFSTN